MHLYTHYPLDPLPKEDQEAGAPPVPDLSYYRRIAIIDLEEMLSGRDSQYLFQTTVWVDGDEPWVEMLMGDASVPLTREAWENGSMVWGQPDYWA